ncbi:hypothetical protein TPHA_0D00840 [Tetrapisispora phaffii CBS 4417]|uniref:Ribosome quality control complex subunit 2 n=1 Tax=Tetrapisispora phaffii (strain ATCC 24235 / CBS 4417 / NBRC 1672 / NRRL Y-8282 / UCD 70-5) TaxID=1071381 RepID=G8BSA6_TETPH|nr:hypothetical protein TPHA_0D00840 [Tetrapisispora phaffii CBS 4417]CCE62727.1 hypothetical protein TPHA_0D00840 [Tetrapisispora phaffii CBS 4417]
MKQRISALDLQLLGEELKNSIEHHRLTNIYNISDSNRQFLLKFNRTESKCSVLVDCGLRIHSTTFNRPIPPAPSGFVVKLRKHLKSKRLTALRQVKNDRILVLQFADGLYYLVLEFFSSGNVILLDEEKKILSLQRVVQEHENRVGEVYTMFDDSLFIGGNEKPIADKREYTEDLIESWINEVKEKIAAEANVISEPGHQKKKLRVPSIHKLLLSKVPHLSSDLISKNLKKNEIDPSLSSLDFVDKISKLNQLLVETEDEYTDLLKNRYSKGYILAKRNPKFIEEKDSKDTEYIYETFHPFAPYVDPNEIDISKVIEVEGPYNNTLDLFFSTIESSKYALRIQNQEFLAKKKLDDAVNENLTKINALRDIQSINEEKGVLIIEKADLIEEVKGAVQSLIDQQMDWNAIENIIRNEQKKRNNIARLIMLPLNLKENKINIILPAEDNNSDDSDNSSSSSDSDSEYSDNSDSDSSDDDIEKNRIKRKNRKNSKNVKIKGTQITIDLALSAFANASEYFNKKKTSAEKQKKVEKNAEKALKNIEERIKVQLNKKLKDSHDILKKIRAPYFFERFNWFFSSEGFLILMGKSPLDTDQIYSKYIEDDDIYMSNSFGTQVWIKNPEKTEIPPNTLMQAGVLCMSASEAWSKKIASSPWWCFAKNVSKFSSDGKSVLEPGLFRMKNDKQQNFLPPAQLVMGFGFLWKVKIEDEGDADDNLNEVREEVLTGDEDNVVEKIVNESADVTDQNELLKEDEEIESFNGMSSITQEINNLDITNADNISNQQTTTNNINEMDASKTVATVLTSLSKNVRGKKGKLKKMQKKYADQDDNERLLRLQVLGTLKGIEKEQEKLKEELSRQEERERKKHRRERQKQLQALSFTESEKVKINYDRLRTELKTTLEPDDEIIDIIPVFAPWPALLKYKYKIKVQPGTAKKQKTVNDILHHFLNRKTDPNNCDKELDWVSEHDIIKSLKAQDLILSISADKLKISIPGQNSLNDRLKGKKSGTGKNGFKSKNKKK